MKKLLTFGLVILSILAFGLQVAAAPQASDMENYAGHPGMTVTQADNGIKVKMDAAEGGTWTTRWGYNYDQVLDGLTINLKNVKMDIMNQSGLCIAIGNYEGAYDADRSLMFVVNSSSDDSAWVFGRTGTPDTTFIQMAGSEISGFSQGVDLTLQWKKKNSTTWVWSINGKEFEFPHSKVTEAIDDEEFVFVTFGGWNFITNIEYTITSIGPEGAVDSTPVKTTKTTTKATTSKTTAASTTTSTTAATTTTSETISNTTEASQTTGSTTDPTDETQPSVSGNTDNEGGLPVGIIVLIIVLVVLLLGAVGFVVYLLVFKSKKAE